MIWILGKNGLLGSSLQKLCKERSIPFIATDRNEADICDLKNLSLAAEKIQPIHIVNCTAYTNVDQAELQPIRAFQINSDGVRNIGVVASNMKAKLVHISTDYVFDGQGKEPYRESDACRPLGFYAKSKMQGEKTLLDTLPSACIIRTSWLFGHGGKNFFSSILSLLKEKEELQVVSDQKGRPTYCKDLSSAILSLLSSSGVYHFANEGEVSRYDIAQDIFSEAKKQGIVLKCKRILPVQSDCFSALAPRPIYSVLSTKKYEQEIEKPRSWKKALQEYLYESA